MFIRSMSYIELHNILILVYYLCDKELDTLLIE